MCVRDSLIPGFNLSSAARNVVRALRLAWLQQGGIR